MEVRSLDAHAARGRLYGRGAADDKAPLPMQSALLRES